MKNLMFMVVATFVSSAISLNAKGQTSLKFIDGIELKPAVSEFSTALPKPEVIVIKSIPNPVKKSVVEGTLSTEACGKIQFKYAQLLNIEIESIINFTLFQFIEDWWRTSYRYGGTGKNGIDCSALTGLLFSTVYGISLPRTAREQYNKSKKIKRQHLSEGDLVFFNTRGGVSHVGVYLSNDYFVHASTSNGVTISSLNDAYYSKKYIGGGRQLSETGNN
ncbi:MAG: NlpC/P60 family protein [Ferruginibacter sp.]